MKQFDEYSSDLSLKRQADSLERIEKLLEKLLETLRGQTALTGRRQAAA